MSMYAFSLAPNNLIIYLVHKDEEKETEKARDWKKRLAQLSQNQQ